MKEKDKSMQNGEEIKEEQYSLNDDRRVKVLSPGAMVAKRFFRNRMAMVGLFVLIFMFVFSFIGGLIMPYGEDELFYRVDLLEKEYAAAIENTEFRYLTAKDQEFSLIVQAKTQLAINNGSETFEYDGVEYTLNKFADDLYTVALSDGTVIGAAYKKIFSTYDESKVDFDVQISILEAYSTDEDECELAGVTYGIDDDGSVTADGEPFGYVSNFVVSAWMPDVKLSREFKDCVLDALTERAESFTFTENGEEHEYILTYSPSTMKWTIKQETESRVYDKYSPPSSKHWLGTDKNGMDVLTRLMYGGRVSLLIGFIVELIATIIGIILGGIAGYFGGWIDNLIMRIVDIFYCIPALPIVIIIGATMDHYQVDPKIRMIYLMLILGVLGWPGIARMVRGQILSLREQEFMTATEASGLSVRRRIFHHLIPNVVPQLIVSVTMGLGGTILTESSLSFLGLGVRFPFASWGNIINDINDTHVLENYLFVWIPAGVLLLLTVLAFNIVGDGLRDAFDPKMKR